MYLSARHVLTFLLLGFANLSSTEAFKCNCQGTLAHSRRACQLVGGSFGEACGYAGCCVTGNQQRRYIEMCNALGYGFRRCDDCDRCRNENES